MNKPETLPFKISMLLYPTLMVVVMWFVFWLDYNNDLHLSKFGVYPRTLKGLRGILFSPFLHGDGSHLWHNTLPIFILSSALIYFYREYATKVIFWGTLFTGLLTWCMGRTSYHIGASGVIYMLFGFLLLKGLLAKNFRLLAVSFFVVFVYGGMIWYITPIKREISWEGHLSGLATGAILALIYYKNILKVPKYKWQEASFEEENDPFVQCFDEHGNFIPTSERLQMELEAQQQATISSTATTIRLIYEPIEEKKKSKTSYTIYKLRSK